MKNRCVESVGFSFRAALWFRAAGDFVYAKFSEINVISRSSCYFFRQVNDSVSFSFLSRCLFSLLRTK